MSSDHEQHQRAPIVGLVNSAEEVVQMDQHQRAPIVGLNANGEEVLMAEQQQTAPIVGLNASGEEVLMEQHQTAPILGLNASGEEMLMAFHGEEMLMEFPYPMRVTLHAYFDSLMSDLEADLSDDVNGGADVDWEVRPATQSSIENLERVKIETSMEVKVCSICLDAITIGMEAIRMPETCSHLYHQDCIVNWLNRSNTCPLCRFQMPS